MHRIIQSLLLLCCALPSLGNSAALGISLSQTTVHQPLVSGKSIATISASYAINTAHKTSYKLVAAQTAADRGNCAANEDEHNNLFATSANATLDVVAAVGAGTYRICLQATNELSAKTYKQAFAIVVKQYVHQSSDGVANGSYIDSAGDWLVVGKNDSDKVDLLQYLTAGGKPVVHQLQATEPGNGFGKGVAIGSNGTQMAIANPNAATAGKVYIYTRASNGSSWQLKQTLDIGAEFNGLSTRIGAQQFEAGIVAKHFMDIEDGRLALGMATENGGLGKLLLFRTTDNWQTVAEKKAYHEPEGGFEGFGAVVRLAGAYLGIAAPLKRGGKIIIVPWQDSSALPLSTVTGSTVRLKNDMPLARTLGGQTEVSSNRKPIPGAGIGNANSGNRFGVDFDMEYYAGKYTVVGAAPKEGASNGEVYIYQTTDDKMSSLQVPSNAWRLGNKMGTALAVNRGRIAIGSNLNSAAQKLVYFETATNKWPVAKDIRGVTAVAGSAMNAWVVSAADIGNINQAVDLGASLAFVPNQPHILAVAAPKFTAKGKLIMYPINQAPVFSTWLDEHRYLLASNKADNPKIALFSNAASVVQKKRSNFAGWAGDKEDVATGAALLIKVINNDGKDYLQLNSNSLGAGAAKLSYDLDTKQLTKTKNGVTTIIGKIIAQNKKPDPKDATQHIATSFSINFSQATAGDVDQLLRSIKYYRDDAAMVAKKQVHIVARDFLNAQSTSRHIINFELDNGSGSAVNKPPQLSLSAIVPTYSEGSSGVTVVKSLSLSDANNLNFANGSYKAVISANLQASADVLGIATGSISLSNALNAGSLVSINEAGLSYQIGEVATTVTNGSALQVNFNANATLERVGTLIKSITYQNLSSSPTTASRTISHTVNDGETVALPFKLSATATSEVKVVRVDDPPTEIKLSKTAINLSQLANGSLIIGSISAEDEDTNAADLSYSLVANSVSDYGSCGAGNDAQNNLLQIVNGNKLALKNAVATAANYHVCIQVKDAASSFEKSFVIAVTDDIAPAVSSIKIEPAAFNIEHKTATVTILFSEEIKASDFTVSKIIVANGSIDNLRQDSSNKNKWTASFIADANVHQAHNKLMLVANSFSDLAGNSNHLAAQSNNYSINTKGFAQGAKPTIGPTNGSKVAGSAPLGASRVEISYNKPTPTTVSVAVASDGSWSQQFLPALADGLQLTVVAKDKAGNSSLVAVATVNAVQPSLTINDIAADNYLNAAEAKQPLPISGTSDASGQVLTVTLNQKSYSTTVAANGKWVLVVPAIDVGALPQGVNNLSARVTNRAETTAQQTATFTKLTTLPDKPNARPTNGVNGLSGTAPASSKVLITLPDNSVFKVAVDGNGKWQLTDNNALWQVKSLANKAVILLQVVDAAGNLSAIKSISVDKTAPQIAINNLSGDNIINAVESKQDLQITGRATVADGQLVTIRLQSWSYQQPVVAGVWSQSIEAAKISTLNDGNYQVTAEVTNMAGNKSLTIKNIQVAKAAPPLNLQASNGSSLRGKTKAQAKVVISLASGAVKQAIADNNGNFTYNFAPKIADKELITAVATDAAGNKSKPQKVQVNSTAPNLSISPIATDDMLNAAESERDLIITGSSSVALSPVVVSLHGVVYRSTTNSAGKWQVTVPKAVHRQLAEGNYMVVATIKNAALVKQKARRAFVKQTTLPPVAIVNPSGGKKLSGTAQPYAVIVITLPDGSELTTVADSSGAWEQPLQTALNNNDVVEVKVKDQAGNLSGSVTTTIDSTRPTINIAQISGDDVLNAAEANRDLLISGNSNAEDGQQVKITLNTVEYTAFVYANKWQLLIDAANISALAEGKHQLLAKVGNRAGNKAQAKREINKQTQPPPMPNVNQSSGARVAGTAQPMSKISILLPNSARIENILVDATGNFSQNFAPPLADGSSIKLIATDSAGNLSLPRQVKIDAKAIVLGLAAVAGNDKINSAKTRSNIVLAGSSNLAPGSVVNIKIISAKKGSQTHIYNVAVKAQANGSFKSTILAAEVAAMADGEYILLATADNKNQQTATANRRFIKDTVLPDSGLINTGDGGAISGKTKPHASVRLIMPNNKQVTVGAGATGAWAYFPKPKLQNGDFVVVRITDKVGNVSADTKAVVVATSSKAQSAPEQSTIVKTGVRGSGFFNQSTILMLLLLWFLLGKNRDGNKTTRQK